MVETGEPGVKPPAYSSKLASRQFQVGISVLQLTQAIDCCLPSSSHLGPAGKNSGPSLHQSTATSLSSWNLNKNRKTERRLAQGNRKAFPFISLTMPVMTNINATDLGPTKELTRSVSLLQPGLLC